MSKEFKGLIELLTDKEFVSYLIEFTKQNDCEIMYFKINSDFYNSTSELLLSSFKFRESFLGYEYWYEIFRKINQLEKQNIK
jgi:hypothetical protein